MRALGVKVGLVGALAVGLGAPSAQATTGVPKVDIDKDGYADTLILGGSDVHVRLTDGNGGADGTWSHLDFGDFSSGFYPWPETAACDFNGDGYTDVAFSNPFYDINGITAGAIYVKYGSKSGLSAGRVWTQSSTSVVGASEEGDGFGAALACGRIGSDSYADLLVGAPGESVGSVGSAGAVTVLKGSSGGLTGTGSYAISQDSSGVAGTAEAYDNFGSSVAVGDITGDGYAELVVVADSENGLGMLHSLKGTSAGWTSTGSTTVSPGAVGGITVGGPIVLGRFDGSGGLDVVFTTEVDNGVWGGAVAVITGTSANLAGASHRLIHQDTSGVPGASEAFDLFGFALAAGDVTGDGRDDLLIGVPGEDVGTREDAGSAVLLKGSSSGITTSGAQSFSQDSAGVAGTAEAEDEFGRTVAISDFNGNGVRDGLIAAPSESLGSLQYAGYVHVLPGTTSGLTATGSLALSSTSIGGTADPIAFGEGLR